MAEQSEAGAVASAAGGEKADPATVFAALAEIICQGSDANEMYAAVCIAATLTVRGCDHASLLVRENDRYVTVAPTTSWPGTSTSWNDGPATAPASTRSRSRRRRSTPT